ncbi:PucR family transcriptional regulator, partial [Levilactobacillus parabrevis]|uniref:PucR family transcriptional regulator n=1 Tax=Levilactobacillus parabrevis TaxID=357278 RepID=UPI0021A4F35C
GDSILQGLRLRVFFYFLKLLLHFNCKFVLKKYDRQHHGELFETLFEFLENDCKISVTADQLHLHRNSLTKRLQKIQDLIEINFDDPDKTFGLRLSYRLFNFLQL